MSEYWKILGDAVSIGALVGYFVSALPVMATLLTVIWTALRIYQEPIVQRWLKRKNNEPTV